jgi:hypothetical protein
MKSVKGKCPHLSFANIGKERTIVVGGTGHYDAAIPIDIQGGAHLIASFHPLNITALNGPWLGMERHNRA